MKELCQLKYKLGTMMSGDVEFLPWNSARRCYNLGTHDPIHQRPAKTVLPNLHLYELKELDWRLRNGIFGASHECLTLRTCELDDGICTLPNRLQRQGLFPIAMVFLPSFYVPIDVSLQSAPLSDLSVCRQYYFRSISLCMHLDRLWYGSMMERCQVQSMASESRYEPTYCMTMARMA